MLSMDTPSIDIGVRGLSYIEVEVTGPNRDLHSGVYGGAVANPITMLAKMIASCHDETIISPFPVFMMMWWKQRKLNANSWPLLPLMPKNMPLI